MLDHIIASLEHEKAALCTNFGTFVDDISVKNVDPDVEDKGLSEMSRTLIEKLIQKVVPY